MKSVLTADFLKNIVRHKHNLITVNPKLQNFFSEIYFEHPQIKNSIPFLPIRCFRDFNLHISGKSHNNTVFYSSGSTNGFQAQHVFSQERLNLYAKKACENFSRFLDSYKIKKSTPIISLIPPFKEWPKSSIAAMITMFKNDRFHINFCDVEKKPESFVKLLLEPQFSQTAIVFGTTFHHLLVAQHCFQNKITQLCQSNQLYLIDTGGTKGRTQSFTLVETIDLLKKAYNPQKEFYFLSEYGMCELASQAWSTKAIHDGTFICNDTLIPVAIDIRKRKALKSGEYGYLGFIDSLNYESWCTIITDDIGAVIDEDLGVFKLKGRAPEATLKGCSLNVNETFFYLNLGETPFSETPPPPEKAVRENFYSPSDIFAFIQNLNQKIWTPKCWSDLSETLASWNEVKITNSTQLAEKTILIISSANIPISWLYPSRIASLMGAKAIHIKLPSIRNNDEFSNKIREKIEDLALKLKPYFQPTQIVIEKSKNISKSMDSFDAVIAFGTDSTIQSFAKILKGTKTHFIPQGDIKNSLKVGLQYSTEEVARLCSLWVGRGCLTPICLFMSGRTEEQTKAWIKEFHQLLDINFIERFKEDGFSDQFIHLSHVLYTEAIVKNLGLDPKEAIHSGKIAHVVDLSQLTEDEVLQSRLDFSFGGCGFIYVLDDSLKPALPQLVFEDIVPKLIDKHRGKTWEEWFQF